jgi:ribosomal protein L37AE/L43A
MGKYGDYYAQQCNERKEPVEEEDLPIVRCPSCGTTSTDLDGFGLQFCARCGYCKHPSLTGETCDLCHRRGTPQEEKP